jgi:ABC-type sugar transport system substrate-binding protein
MSKVKFIAIMALVVAVVVAMSILPGCQQAAEETAAAETTAAVEETTAAAEETTAAAEETEAEAEETEPGCIAPSDINLGLILHVNSAYTESMRRGAEAAGRWYGVNIEVLSPEKPYDTLTQISMFDGFIEKGFNGIGILAAEPASWPVPIEAAAEKGVLVYTMDSPIPESKSSGYVGPLGYSGGLLFVEEINKLTEFQALNGEGKVIIGACAPEHPIVSGRVNGEMNTWVDSTNFELKGPFASGLTHEESYTFWESQYLANPDSVLFVGNCCFDLPAIAKHKDKTPDAPYLAAGWDLEPEGVQGVKDGTIILAIGTHPYLQGYLPMALMCEQLINGNAPAAAGFLDVGLDPCKAENVDVILQRETDETFEEEWYRSYIDENFGEVWTHLAPWAELNMSGEALWKDKI